MDLSQFGKMLLYMLPLLLVCFALNRINLNKVNRSRQFIMPIVALAYCILDIIFLDFINNLLMKFFDWLAKHFSIFQDLSWQHVAVLMLNLFFVIGFILIKLIILPIINAIWQSDKICEGTSSLFYDKEEDVGKWLLKPNLANYRAYIKSFYIVTVAAAVLIVALYQIFPDSILFQVEIYPVFAVIVLGEVVSFLSGITKPEFVEDILGEDDESYKVANYGVLRKILRELFGDRVLYDVTTDTNSGSQPTQYQKNCFLKFGYENIDDSLDIDGTIEVLDELGFNNNPLYQVRCSSELAENSIENYEPNKSGVHYCDFCGAELYGTEYELLQDGRERCNRCSMTAIRNVEDFKDLYKTVLRNMEAFYGIKINTAIKVRTTNSKKIAKHFGSDFVGTPNFDGRVLGFAQKDKTGYSLYIENGSPKLAASATIAHELTHIWQYLNWNEEDIEKKYGKKNTLAVYEGMAKWAEIQYLMLMNEKAFAKREEIITRSRDDEYGIGFIVYAEKYPLSNNPNVEDTPFKNNYPL